MVSEVGCCFVIIWCQKWDVVSLFYMVSEVGSMLFCNFTLCQKWDVVSLFYIASKDTYKLAY